MIFVGVALLIAVGLAFVVSADAGTLIGLNQSQTAQLVALLAVLILVASGSFGRRRRLGEMVGNLVVWGGLFAVSILAYSYRDELTSIGNRMLAELTPGAAVVDVAGGTATFRRAIGGSFRVNAEVNGQIVHMIFDTGASAVVLSQEDARSAGIEVENLRYSVAVQTANGTGRAALVVLDEISVGGISRGNVRAFVSEAGALETSLLGMTYLETLSGFAVNGDALVLSD